MTPKEKELVEVLRHACGRCLSNETCSCEEQYQLIQRMDAENERLRTALGQIAGKNDLSGVADDMVETAARNALYECELIARAALAVHEQRPVKGDGA